MGAARGEKIICCVLAMILFFLGISVEVKNADASFLHSENAAYSTRATISSTNHMEEETVCTLNMLINGSEVLRSNMSNSMVRGSYQTCLSFFIVGAFLQYLFYYQSAESKEDGQLFLCRTVVVDYIHLKDSGE